MIICQYDIQKLNPDTLNHLTKELNNTFAEDNVVVVPSGLSIAEFSDEEGIEILEQVYKFLGNLINSLKTT